MPINDPSELSNGADEIVVYTTYDVECDVWRAWAHQFPRLQLKMADEPSLLALAEKVIKKLAPATPHTFSPGIWPSYASLSVLFDKSDKMHTEIAEIKASKTENFDAWERRCLKIDERLRDLLSVATDEIGLTHYTFYAEECTFRAY